MNSKKRDDEGEQKSHTPRDRAIDALMTLAAQRPWTDITLADVAGEAGLSLAQFRDAFPSKGAVLGGFSRRIDRIVLDATTDDLAAESVKDRLFDVLMRRFDALKPYKTALDSINAWAMRDPLALAEFNKLAVNSMRFMLEAAGGSSEGPLGAVKLQGLAMAWSRVFHVWLADESEDLAKTMAALDKELERGKMLTHRLDEARKTLAPLANPLIGLAERFLGMR
ncbi:TetR/AcrR family transcriptional regulator [Rhodoblastus acidophilus]|uniref:TetR/AcrR family transcriptional regulator n=1 Tax=Rhodoblastus acidophilus TaxID=1074 RepID=A0A6N8DK99_RHOAC|nr:TetR/AcrR family transcriptional regulator [Rhodoblastus acidophilus]MCW2272702.1 AcrR family transcriptional regulator [Rhodoblastus acidophilus]MTV29613.1 TetR/AcrR family transcriptional regulator [Rhodoblastus acidophilus]